MVVLFVFLVFASIALIAIIASRGGQITDGGILLDSGVVRIQTDPVDIKARFYIDNDEIIPSDERINGLLEGEYNLRIESDGYAIWQKDIIVRDGLVVDVYAKLYPSELALEQLTNTNIQRAFFSPNGEYVYYIVKDTQFGTDRGLWRMRLTSGQFIFNTGLGSPEKIANISPQIDQAISNNNYEITVSPDNNRLLFNDMQGQKVFVLDADGFNETPLLNLTLKLGFNPEFVSWFNGSGSLIIQQDGLVFEHSLSTDVNTIVRFSPNGDVIFAAGNTAVFFTDSQTGRLFVYKKQSSEPIKLASIEIPSPITELHSPINNEQYLLLRSEDGYYYLDTERSFLKLIANTAQMEFHEFSQDGRSVLFLDDGEIYAFNAKEIIATNTIETTFNNTGLTLTGDADVVGFVPQSSHIIHYANGKKHTITVAERDGANHTVLLNDAGIKNSDFSFDSDGNNFVVLLKDETVKANQSSSPRANLYSYDLDNPGSAK